MQGHIRESDVEVDEATKAKMAQFVNKTIMMEEVGGWVAGGVGGWVVGWVGAWVVGCGSRLLQGPAADWDVHLHMETGGQVTPRAATERGGQSLPVGRVCS